MPEITKEQILAAITARFFDDLPFIERVNDITFHQKRKLQAIKGGRSDYTTNSTKNGEI